MKTIAAVLSAIVFGLVGIAWLFFGAPRANALSETQLCAFYQGGSSQPQTGVGYNKNMADAEELECNEQGHGPSGPSEPFVGGGIVIPIPFPIP